MDDDIDKETSDEITCEQGTKAFLPPEVFIGK